MVSVERVRASLLKIHGGDTAAALDNAIDAYLWAVGNMSCGHARVNPYKETMPPKPRPAEPVVLESER